MLLLVLGLLQGSQPALTASVDHAHVRVGDQLTLTIQARSRSTEALTLLLPGLTGFTMVGSREATQVSFGGTGGPERVTIRELALQAERPGRLVIGSITAVQGSWRARTAPIAITVDSGVLATTTSQITRALLAAAPPPARTDQVSLTLVVSRDTISTGAQLDVVAAAWFPRTVRNQLTRDPLLALPTPVGAWGYPPDGPAGVAASRQVRGQWMDLFVIHQTLFPLAGGRLVLPPATLDYALPVTASILTREERYALTSDSLVIAVQPLPTEGRPADDRGAVGRGLSLSLAVDSTPARVGEPLQVTVTVAGIGNVTLWPEPEISWPASLHAYAGEEETQIVPQDGTIAGAKAVRYLVVPDSTGSILIPEVRYPFFDPGTRAYAVARVPPRTLSVGPGLGIASSRATLPLLSPRSPDWATAMTREAWPWGWLVIVFAPPFVVLLARALSRTRPEAAEPVPARVSATRLGKLERDFQGMLVAYVADAEGRDGDALAAALRAAGLERAVADHVVRLRDRLRAARYGPHGTADQAELAEELTQVLKVLGAEPASAGSARRHVRILTVLALGALAPAARAQVSSPEALYRAGALRAAADGFAARAARNPEDAATWYDLGAASYRAGADGRAAAAWARAARLAPRDAAIRHARALLSAPDLASEDLLSVGPLTRWEWAALAGACWMLWWASLLLSRRRLSFVLALAVLGAAGFGGYEWWRMSRAIVVVVEAPAPVRSAPFGEASAASSLPAGAAALVVQAYGGWVEVSRPDGVRGWILESEVMRL
jgi:hypothetical protein